MSASLDLVRAAANLASGLTAATDTCRALLRDRADGSVVIGVVDEAHPVSRLLQELVSEPDLFLHGVRVDLLQIGSADRDCRARRQVWPQMHQPADIRVRRLDTLYAEGRKVALLVIAGHPDPAQILASAADLLRRSSPLVLVDLCSVNPAQRSAVLSAITDMLPGWMWSDSRLLGLSGGADAIRLLDDFAETIFMLSSPKLSAPPGVSSMRAIAWAGWRVPVVANQTARRVIRPDALFQSEGFYGPEGDGEHTWRWTGPDRAARAFIPLPGFGAWSVKIEVFSWGILHGAQDVRVALNGGRLQHPEHSGNVLSAGTATSLPGDLRRHVQLDLVCARLRPSTYQDPRILGLCVCGIVLEREV